MPFLLDDGAVGIGGWHGFPPWRPTRKLDIYDAGSDARIAFHSDLTGVGFTDGSVLGPSQIGHFYVWNYETTNMYFGTNNQRRIFLSRNGYLGIGPDLPVYPLHMASGARCTLGGFGPMPQAGNTRRIFGPFPWRRLMRR